MLYEPRLAAKPSSSIESNMHQRQQWRIIIIGDCCKNQNKIHVGENWDDGALLLVVLLYSLGIIIILGIV